MGGPSPATGPFCLLAWCPARTLSASLLLRRLRRSRRFRWERRRLAGAELERRNRSRYPPAGRGGRGGVQEGAGGGVAPRVLRHGPEGGHRFGRARAPPVVVLVGVEVD